MFCLKIVIFVLVFHKVFRVLEHLIRRIIVDYCDMNSKLNLQSFVRSRYLGCMFALSYFSVPIFFPVYKCIQMVLNV